MMLDPEETSNVKLPYHAKRHIDGKGYTSWRVVDANGEVHVYGLPSYKVAADIIDDLNKGLRAD
jgi:hypothetical protein